MVFEVSLLADTLITLAAAVILFVFAFGLFLPPSPTPNHIPGVITLFIAVWLSVEVYRLNHAFVIKRSVFRDDSFEIWMPGGHKSLGYGDVEEVSLARTIPPSITFGLRPQLLIKIKGASSVLVIQKNAKSRRLGTNLYSWLTQKLRARGPS